MTVPALEIVQPVAQEGDVSIRHEDVAYSEPFSMVYNWTWDIPVSLVAHGLYGYLLHCCGQKGHMWHRQKTIATALHITEKTLRRYLDELEDHGLIRQENRQEKGLPSIIYIRTKDAVMRRQTLRENLPKVGPTVKVTAALGKNDRTLREKIPSNRTKRREQNEENKTKVSLGAGKPRRATVSLKAVSTEDDETAPDARRLALGFCRRVFGWQTINPKNLTRYEAYFSEALAQGKSVLDCKRFTRYVASNGYWTKDNAQTFNDAQFAKEWDAWEGAGEPEEKAKRQRDRTPAHIQREHDYGRNGEVDYSHEEQTPCCGIPVRFGHAYDCPHRAEGVGA